MSFNLSWIAFQTTQHAPLLEAMRLEPTGETGNWGDADDWSLLELDSGWSILISKEEFFDNVEEAIFARRSAEGALHWGYAGDVAMASCLFWYEGGRKQWSFEWDGSEGAAGAVPHLTGLLPDFAQKVLEECRRDQDIEDADTSETFKVDHMFDIPARITEHLTGYRYDTCLEDGRDDRCVYLRRLPAQRPVKSGWAKLNWSSGRKG